MVGNSERYSVYIMRSDPHGYEEAAISKYAKINKGYVLIYATAQPPESAELTDKEVLSLPKTDKDWIDACNRAIIQDYVAQNQDLLESSREKFLEEFARELEKEWVKTNGEK